MSIPTEAPASQPKQSKLVIALRVIAAIVVIAIPVGISVLAASMREQRDDMVVPVNTIDTVVTVGDDQRGLIFADDNTITTVLSPGEHTVDGETIVYLADNVSQYDNLDGWLPATISFGEDIYPIDGWFGWDIPFDKTVSRYNEVILSGEPFNVLETFDLEDHALMAQALQQIVYVDVINTVLDAQYSGEIPMLEYAPVDASTPPAVPNECWQAWIEPINWLAVKEGMESIEVVRDTITFIDFPSIEMVLNSDAVCEQSLTA
jgi:hypothetical protein